MAVENGKTCKEYATSYITLIDAKARVYCQVVVIFDSYTKEASMKAHTVSIPLFCIYFKNHVHVNCIHKSY